MVPRTDTGALSLRRLALVHLHIRQQTHIDIPIRLYHHLCDNNPNIHDTVH